MKWQSGYGLYAVTDRSPADFLDRTAQVLAGGVGLLQYRNQGQAGEVLRREATQLVDLCRSSGVPLLIDGDVALALAVGAHGVHLDNVAGVEQARIALGEDAIIGVACRGSLPAAKAAVSAGANYVSFGAFFPSPTLPDAPQVPIDLLRNSRSLGVPRVAIGGITPDNGRSLLDAGADYLAAVSALFAADDPRRAAKSFNTLFRRPTPP